MIIGLLEELYKDMARQILLFIVDLMVPFWTQFMYGENLTTGNYKLVKIGIFRSLESKMMLK
jgi:hypothetical protein